MSEYATSRFGWDAPSRIVGSTVMLQEQGEMPVGLPLYTPLPFVPLITSGSTNGSTTSDGMTIWQTTPTRVNLLFYQGDDVVIPLYFNDPAVTGDDMSTQQWFAQIRVLHSYGSTLVAQFVTSAEYTAATVDTPEYTKVELFLPRVSNKRWGTYHWDLYSIAATDLSRFPPPTSLDPAVVWPPVDALRTWLFGDAVIVPRVTSTDVMPVPPPAAIPIDGPVVHNGGVVWPNGRVP